MNSTIKYTIIIIALLLIGFVIGFLVNGRITNQRMLNIRSINTEQGFNYEFRRMVKPSPEQMEELEPILKKYADLNYKRMVEFRDQQKEIFREMRSEIEPYLTEEQIDKLDCLKKRQSKRHPMDKKRRSRSKKRN